MASQGSSIPAQDATFQAQQINESSLQIFTDIVQIPLILLFSRLNSHSPFTLSS